MCGVAKGIIRGLGRHYGERLVLEEPTCMLKGGSECQIVVKRLG
jgi:predicted hydrocarbon binding protein